MGEYREIFNMESNDVKLLGVTIDRDPKFEKDVLKLCSKTNQELSALSRMANKLSFNKRRTLFKLFFGVSI